jgi:hypothetical protein
LVKALQWTFVVSYGPCVRRHLRSR